MSELEYGSSPSKFKKELINYALGTVVAGLVVKGAFFHKEAVNSENSPTAPAQTTLQEIGQQAVSDILAFNDGEHLFFDLSKLENRP